MGHVLLFSLTASANPTLIATTTLMLLLPNPRRLMLGYLAGAMLVSITLGIVIVFALQNSGAVHTAQHSVNPAVDLVVAALLAVLAIAIHSGGVSRAQERRRERKTTSTEAKPSRWRRALDSGSARTAFVVGMVLTLPGASYLAALTSLTKVDTSDAAKVLSVIGINVIMLWLLEVPLIAFTVAPERTPAALERAKAWLSRHGERVVVVGAGLLSALLAIRGVVTLLA